MMEGRLPPSGGHSSKACREEWGRGGSNLHTQNRWGERGAGQSTPDPPQASTTPPLVLEHS